MTEPGKKPDAKEALLIAACRLFTERGYESVSTRELAEAAGVNLGAIQYHFGSKGKLFVATVYRLMAERTPHCHPMHAPFKSRHDAAERVGENRKIESPCESLEVGDGGEYMV